MNWFHAIEITGEVNDITLLKETTVVLQGSYETLHPPHKEKPHKAVLPEACAVQCFSSLTSIDLIQEEFVG